MESHTQSEMKRRHLTAKDGGGPKGGGGPRRRASGEGAPRYETYPIDCATSGYPRLIHGPETWRFLQDAHARSRGSVANDNDGGDSIIDEEKDDQPHHGFLVDFEVRDDGPRGRSIYATEPIPEGTQVYIGRNVVKFATRQEMVAFLKLLPHDLQCDVLLWAFMSGRHVYVALDEGSFVNHGESEERVTLDGDCRTVRDVAKGEELLENYGEFVSQEGGWFNDLRKGAWREEPEGRRRKKGKERLSLNRYVSLGAPKLRADGGRVREKDDDGWDVREEEVLSAGGIYGSPGGWAFLPFLLAGATCLAAWRRRALCLRDKEKDGM